MRTINGNLLLATEQYVAHQCNCVSRGAFGLASSIFKSWPTANVYDKKNCPPENRKVGKIFVSSTNCRPIIAMFAQHWPGGPSSLKVPGTNLMDDAKNRLAWFRECLDEISKLNPESVAFPYAIGCGLARGEWNDYLSLLGNVPFKAVLYKKVMR